MSARVAAALVAVALSVLAPRASAQAPIVNARVERRAPASSLAAEIESVIQRGSATWIGYRVPLRQRSTPGTLRQSGTCCRCRLDPSTDLVVMVRVEAGAIAELRSIAVDCDVDAAGAPLVWLEPVAPADSVAWLGTLAMSSARPKPIVEAAVSAIARHADPSAQEFFTRLLK